MFFKAKAEQEKRKKGKIREAFESLAIAIFAVMILRSTVVQAYHVPTGSMKSTVLIGDFLLVNKFIYGARTPDSIPFIHYQLPHMVFPAFKDPEPGEIVVFKYPPDPSIDYVKRCIAVGGQTIELRDGDVYIDGKPEGKKEFLRREYDPDPDAVPPGPYGRMNLGEARLTREKTSPRRAVGRGSTGSHARR